MFTVTFKFSVGDEVSVHMEFPYEDKLPGGYKIKGVTVHDWQAKVTGCEYRDPAWFGDPSKKISYHLDRGCPDRNVSQNIWYEHMLTLVKAAG